MMKLGERYAYCWIILTPYLCCYYSQVTLSTAYTTARLLLCPKQNPKGISRKTVNYQNKDVQTCSMKLGMACFMHKHHGTSCQAAEAAGQQAPSQSVLVRRTVRVLAYILLQPALHSLLCCLGFNGRSKRQESSIRSPQLASRIPMLI